MSGDTPPLPSTLHGTKRELFTFSSMACITLTTFNRFRLIFKSRFNIIFIRTPWFTNPFILPDQNSVCTVMSHAYYMPRSTNTVSFALYRSDKCLIKYTNEEIYILINTMVVISSLVCPDRPPVTST